MRPEDTEMIANICSFQRMEAAINEFQPFKAPGPDKLYPVLLRKGWNQLKGYYQFTMSFFKHARDTAMCHRQGMKAQVYFSPNPERKAISKLNPSA